MESAFFTYFIKIPGEIICPPSSTALGKIKIKTNAVKGQIYIINKAFLDEQEWAVGEDGVRSLLVPMNFVYVCCRQKDGSIEIYSHNNMYALDGGVPEPLEVQADVIYRGAEVALSFKSNQEREIGFMPENKELVKDEGQGAEMAGHSCSCHREEEHTGCEIVILVVMLVICVGMIFTTVSYKALERLGEISTNTRQIAKQLQCPTISTEEGQRYLGDNVARRNKTVEFEFSAGMATPVSSTK